MPDMWEVFRVTDTKKKTGIRCPACNGKTEVLRTIGAGGITRRNRLCLKPGCRVYVYSVETIVASSAMLPTELCASAPLPGDGPRIQISEEP